MDFRPLAVAERESLIKALRGNALEEKAIMMSKTDTSFLGMADAVTDDEVINCIKSVPVHY